jgi:hypothetical protein
MGGARHGRGNSLRFFFCTIFLSVYNYSEGEPPLPDSLSALEAQRTQILRQISALGDLRPGSISAVVRRCGKPTCHCAKPNDPGHDPQLRLMRTVNGKTIAESFASPAAFHKAQAEVHEYQRWQRLCAELVDVSERICRLRPLQKQPEKWSAEEKKRLLRSIKRSHAN